MNVAIECWQTSSNSSKVMDSKANEVTSKLPIIRWFRLFLFLCDFREAWGVDDGKSSSKHLRGNKDHHAQDRVPKSAPFSVIFWNTWIAARTVGTWAKIHPSNWHYISSTQPFSRARKVNSNKLGANYSFWRMVNVSHPDTVNTWKKSQVIPFRTLFDTSNR